MSKIISITAIAAAVLGFVAFAEIAKQTRMPEVEEAPKTMTKEQASKLTEEDWEKRLTPIQHYILRESGTERPNGIVYKQFKKQGDGTYHCAGCNAELFSSDTKFDSGSGWPSFYDIANAENIKTITDSSGGMTRTEVRCAVCDGHLGHVFFGESYDTPTKKRYCINGSALQFAPETKTETK